MNLQSEAIKFKTRFKDGSLGTVHGVKLSDENGPLAAATVTSRSLGRERGQVDVFVHVRTNSEFVLPTDTHHLGCLALNGPCLGEAMTRPGLLHENRKKVAEKLETILNEELSIRERMLAESRKQVQV